MADTPQTPLLADLPRSRGVRLWLQLALLCVAYFAAARGSTGLAFVGSFACPIWPPAGLALAGVVLLGRSALPAIALGDVLTNLAGYAESANGLTALSLPLSVYIAVGNTIEATLGGWLVRRYASSGHFLNAVGDVGRFTLMTIASAAISAAFGISALQLGGTVRGAAIGATFLTWWLGNTIGMLVVTPFVIGWSNLARPRASELALVLLTVALAWCAFSGAFDQLTYGPLLIYAAIPLLATAALLFGLRHTATVTLIWSGAAVWGTVRGHGPFASGRLSDSLILLDTFLALASLTGLLLATDRHETQHTRGSVNIRALAPSWGALLGCFALTVAAWHVITSDTERRADERFAYRLTEIKRRIEERMVAYEEVLWGCVGLLQASNHLSQTEWSAYLRAQQLSRIYPGIHSVGYVNVVLPADKLAHETRIRAEGVPEYTIRPPGSRDVYTPISFVAPMNQRNRSALGFDMFSEPVRRAAMELARASGQATLSGRIALLQATDTSVGLIMYLPHYRGESRRDTPEAQRAMLVGYAYSRFRMSDLMGGLLTDHSHFVSLEIFDGPKMSAATLLHASRPLDARADPTYRRPFVHTSTSTVGQRVWTLRATSLPPFESLVDRQKAQIVLFAGAALSLFFFVMVRTLALTRIRALELADKMTAALQDSETRFVSLANAASEGIVLLDPEGAISAWNAGAAAMFDAPEEDMRGVSWLTLLIERERAGALALWRTLLEEAQGSVSRILSVRGRNKSGREFPLEISLCSWVGKERRKYGLIVRDISERERAAEQLHATLALQTAILDSAALGIIAIDPSGIILTCNRAAERMLGYSERELVHKQTPAILLLKEELYLRAETRSRELGRRFDADAGTDASFRVLLAALRAGGIYETEWTYVRKDESTFPVLLTVTTLQDLSGEISGYLAGFVDISERKRREQEVQAALHEKETLLKEVYHRVKNNLQVISSLFNLQLRSLPEGPARASLLEGAARVRAMALVHEKLYQSTNLSSIPLGSYIGDLCGQLVAAGAAKQRGIALALELDPDPVDAGPELAVPLGLLLNELVSNSLKHGFPDGRRGTIHVVLRRESAERVRLEVWDDGAGFRAGATDETSRSLGLRLVRTLSRQLDGELTLENRSGAYARISFGLGGAQQGRKSA